MPKLGYKQIITSDQVASSPMNCVTDILGVPSHCKCKVKSVSPLSVDLEKHMTTVVEKGLRWPARKSQHLDPAVAELEQIW